MHMRHKQQGFTMIELIMVIVILGILTAVALPKFYDMQGDARIAKMKSAAAALRSGYAIAHSAYLVKGGGSVASVTLEGIAVTLVNGYPDTVVAADDAAARTAIAAGTMGAAIAAGGLVDYTLASTATVLTVTPDAAHTNCTVTYTEAGANAAPTVSEAGLIDTNCK